MQDNQYKNDLTVWHFISFILSIYGAIFIIIGGYYASNPPDIALAEYNASLWWGILMLLSGIYFYFVAKKS